MFPNPYKNKFNFDKDKNYDDLVELFKKQYDAKAKLNIPPHRSTFNRIIDAVSTSLYVTAGAAKGVIDPDSTTLGNVWEGLKAGNPFGEGNEKGENTFSDVLETAGWKPESTLGKIGKGVTGFGLDVMLDPATWFTGGLSAAVRGTGKAGLRATHDVEKLGSNIGRDVFDVALSEGEDVVTASSKAIDTAKEFAEKGMTTEMAEAVIRKQGKTPEEEIAKSAEMFAKKYNSVIGLRNTNRDLTFGMRNMPFIGHKLTDKAPTVVSTAEAISAKTDAFFGKNYAKLRNAVYGSKLGELFGKDTPLFRMSKTDPAGVYEILRAHKIVKGHAGNLAIQKAALRTMSEKYANLPPSEQKQIMDFLQDKNIMHQITKRLSFLETKEGTRIKNELVRKQKTAQKEYSKVVHMKRMADTAGGISENGLPNARVFARVLEDEHTAALANFDVKNLRTPEELALIKSDLEEKVAKLYNEKPVKQVASIPKTPPHVTPAVLEEGAQVVDDVVTPPSSSSDELMAKYKAYIESVNARNVDIKMAKSEAMEDYVEITPIGKGANKVEFKEEKYVNAIDPRVSDNLIDTHRMELIDSLSEHIFGEKGVFNVLPGGVSETSLKQLVNMISSGKTNAEVQNWLLKRPHLTQKWYADVLKSANNKFGNFYDLEILKRKIKEGLHQQQDQHIKELQEELTVTNQPTKVRAVKGVITKSKNKIKQSEEAIEQAQEKLKGIVDTGNIDSQINLIRDNLIRLSGSEDVAELSAFRSDLAGVDYSASVAKLTKLIDAGNEKVHEMTAKMGELRSSIRTVGNDAEQFIRLKGGLADLEKASNVELASIKKYEKQLGYDERNANIQEQFMQLDELTTKRQSLSGTGKPELQSLIREQQAKIKIHQDRIKANEELLDEINPSGEKVIAKQKELDDLLTKKSQGVVKGGTPDSRKYLELQQRLIQRGQYIKELQTAHQEGKDIYEMMRQGENAEISKLAEEILEEKKVAQRERAASKIRDEEGAEYVGSDYEEQISQVDDVLGQLGYKMEGDKYQLLQEVNKDINSSDVARIFADIPKEQFDDVVNYTNSAIIPEIERIIKEVGKEYKKSTSLQKEAIIKQAIRNAKARLEGKVDNIVLNPFDKKHTPEYHRQFAEGQYVLMGKNSYVKSRIKGDSGVVFDGQTGQIIGEKIIDENTSLYKVRTEDGKVVDNVTTSEIDKVKPVKATETTPVEAIVNDSELSRTHIDDLERQLEDVKRELAQSTEVYAKREMITADYTKRITEAKDNIARLELTAQKLQKARSIDVDEDDISSLAYELSRYDEALSSDEAFLTYVGTKRVNEVESLYNKDLGKTVLDANKSIPQRVKEVTLELRGILDQIGASEVAVGKLTQEQFDAMRGGYLPHILTEEGKELFVKDDIVKKLVKFGDDYGFGRVYDPFAESRKITKLFKDDGSVIENPTIAQLNEHFAPLLKGKNAYVDGLSDLFLARAVKNAEIIYDAKFTDEMLGMFGTAFKYTDDAKAGYKVVMNFGKMRETSGDIAGLHVDMDISKAISSALTKEEIAHIEREILLANEGIMVGSKEYKGLFGAGVSKWVNDFVETNFSSDVKSAMYKDYVGKFAGDSLTDMAMPMIEMDVKGAKGLMDSYDNSLITYTEHMADKTIRLVDSLVYQTEGVHVDKTFVDGIREMELPKLRQYLENNFKGVYDEIDEERIDYLINKMKKAEEIKPLQISHVQDGIVNKLNQARKIQIEKDQNSFLQMYDKFTHLIKLNQTTIMPAFHVRNKLSNMYLNWLEIGQDAFNIDFQRNAWNAVRAEGKGTESVLNIVKNGEPSTMSWNELYRLGVEHNVINEGYFAKDLGVGANTKGLFPRLGKWDATNTTKFKPYELGAKVGGTVENQDRLIHFASQLSRGMSVEDAAESVNKYLFDYSDLTAFEQRVMKRIFPYYTWLRKNSALQLEMLLDRPEKFLYVSKVIHGIEGMTNREDRMESGFVNDFALDWIQTPFTTKNEQGKEEPILLNPNLPFMDLSRIPNPLSPVNSLKNLFTQSNPMIKVPVEQAANYNVFYDSPIVDMKYNPSTKEYEKESEFNRLDHVASQSAGYAAGKGLVNKTGVDFGLQMVNALTGVKAMSYDYETYKNMKIQEILESGNKSSLQQSLTKQLESFGGAIVKGFKGQVSRATNTLGDAVTKDRPLNPDEYTNALRPISQVKYDKLSSDEKALYTPPTKDIAEALNKRAVELSAEEYAKTGGFKQFVWSVFDEFNWGDRNKDSVLGEVTSVTDGDTFKVKIGDKTETVRLLLIDTPETVDRKTAVQPVGKEASNYAKSSLMGKDARIIFDGPLRDSTSSKRMLGYVEVNGQDINKELVSQGLAKVGYEFQPHYTRKDAYRKAELEASQKKEGIWSLPGYAEVGKDKGYKAYPTDEQAKLYSEAIKRRLAQ